MRDGFMVEKYRGRRAPLAPFSGSISPLVPILRRMLLTRRVQPRVMAVQATSL